MRNAAVRAGENSGKQGGLSEIVRISPSLHRSLALFAASHNKTLNASVEEAIGGVCRYFYCNSEMNMVYYT